MKDGHVVQGLGWGKHGPQGYDIKGDMERCDAQ